MNLLKPSTTYKPFAFPWAFQLAVQHEKMHWIEAEAKLNEDVLQWSTGKLSAEEKKHITSILRLFTQSDVAVGTNYIEHFLPVFKNNEVRAMLTSFVNREFVHQRAYALLNDTLGLPESEYYSFLEYAEMRDKIEFMQQADVSTPEGIALALIQSVCNEGMSLFSAFIMLLNYQRKGKMRGMCEIVEWSIRDETAHVEGIVKLFRAFCDENPSLVVDSFKKKVYSIFRNAVELEDKVIDLAYQGCEIQGLSKEEVKQYIRYLADRRLIQLGFKGNFKVKENPIPWVDWVVNGAAFKNFFEGVVTDYSANGMTGELHWN